MNFSKLFLETKRIRDWINNQESKFAQKAKQAKKKVLAAKDKVKSLKQKLADELAKAITAKDGSSLSISEHDEIVSQIKCEAAQAHKEMLESMNMAPKGNSYPTHHSPAVGSLIQRLGFKHTLFTIGCIMDCWIVT
ncbi:hypothetical protein DCAR_0519677 [Daucus carota subsp. sativus]|uniref:Uncharacterized protein n=1 Tax=Daucus carota subsp. sativus TaxID=79200 RepID=A0A164YA61_DAUCS|nr:hypothetical protein DCAR_0519677 [Daucus carota subsp. sativus]